MAKSLPMHRRASRPKNDHEFRIRMDDDDALFVETRSTADDSQAKTTHRSKEA
jgi:hypothetical protein